MAQFIDEPSRTFNEYLLIPGFTSKDCTPENVDLSSVKRNDLCPCGSGKKFKNCHGRRN